MLVEKTLLLNDNFNLFEYNVVIGMIFPLFIDNIFIIYRYMPFLDLFHKGPLEWKISHNAAEHY